MDNKIAAIVLAGGKSQRMGTDKGLMDLKGKTFIRHICDALSPIVGKQITIVSADKRYDELGFERVADLIENKGPVGGLYTGLTNSKCRLNLVLSVDVPLVSTELLRYLVERHHPDYMISQFRVGDKTSPLIGLYNREVLGVFKAHLDADQLRLRQVIEAVTHQSIEVPQQWSYQLQNINTMEDYQKIIA